MTIECMTLLPIVECNTNTQHQHQHWVGGEQLHVYFDMRDALNKTGRRIGYSICPNDARCNDPKQVQWCACVCCVILAVLVFVVVSCYASSCDSRAGDVGRLVCREREYVPR